MTGAGAEHDGIGQAPGGGAAATRYAAHQKWQRRMVIFSVWVVILLGIPLWIHTTSIYRAPLPLAEMLRWDDGHACEAARYAKDGQGDLSQRDKRVIKYSSEYNVAFTLVNGGGQSLIESWAIEPAIRGYLNPLISQLSGLCNITVESQIQHFSELPVTPQRADGAGGGFYLPGDRLPMFINAAESDASATFSTRPTINLLLYVPAAEYRPLTLRTSQEQDVATNAFLVPQWGSVVVYNPPGSDVHHLTAQDLQVPMSVFATHLLRIFGIQAVVDPSTGRVPEAALERVMHERVVENVYTAGSTLASFARLATQMSGLEIPAEVSKQVAQTIMHLQKACEHLCHSETREALVESAESLSLAEKAFFNPEMSTSLYAVDEHKIGIYVPLFGPLSLPVALAAFREILALVREWRA